MQTECLQEMGVSEFLAGLNGRVARNFEELVELLSSIIRML